MAEALPASLESLPFSTREAPRRIPSGSLSFRERLPQMADSRRFDGVAVATQEAASAIRVVDLSGNS